MGADKKIKSALVSVYHKDNLEAVIRALHSLNITLYATGGTQDFIEKLGIPVVKVEELTSYPSILGGRVKTLHPKIFGGILSRRENKEDVMQLEEYRIPEIDLVIVDLYPFEQTAASGAGEEEIIEKIDIGGISLIRAAAKNFRDVLIIPSRSEYAFLLNILEKKNGISSPEERKQMASRAFGVSSAYDTAIRNYFSGSAPGLQLNVPGSQKLRYGENPHQPGTFFGDLSAMFEQLSGKELSYNNLLDIDAAVCLMQEFSEPAIAILKHNNACGLACRPSLAEAWKDALAGDPVSAFGGIIISNRPVDKPSAEEINKLFFEVLIAPAYEPGAADLLKQKKNRILLVQKNVPLPPVIYRSALNGILGQDRDLKTETLSDLKTVTAREPDTREKNDLIFANKIVKHTKSNTIVLAKDNRLIASGVGQTSRVDALKQAIAKAHSFGFSLKGAVMASDAFFPFPDCVQIAHEAGITAVIQPGGSVKDQDSIDACNHNGMAMVTTGVRHFKH
jgi:phosphoribosylaminoimidazolecarboxamide formyltransferase/IMP cyclohydrolase